LARNLHSYASQEKKDSTMLTYDLFSEVYSKGFISTVRFLIGKGARPEEAEEVAQSAWTRGWEARHQLADDTRVVPWVIRIAYRQFCDEKRRQSRLDELTDDADGHRSTPDVSVQTDVERLMERCSMLDRSLLKTRYFDGNNMEEIARIHGLTAVGVRVRIHRCKAELRRWMKLNNPITA
jgi:RNA polymerase sigma-70 factor (ECF subfamily)